MHTLVEVRTPDGTVVSLSHGALIGRLWTADVHVDDARVSEAHAMVSLRGRDVRLLALRGRLLVDGHWRTDVVLRPGAVVSLAEGLDLEVVTTHVPAGVLAMEAPGLTRRVLVGVTALKGGPQPRLSVGWDASADAHVWPTGEAWMFQRTDHGGVPPVVVAHDDTWTLGGTPFRAVVLHDQGAEPTRVDPDYARPITLTARYDTVHLARAGLPVVVLSGLTARVVSELVVARTAIAWDALASQCWRDADRERLRHRWDMLLLRLRAKLAAHGVRPDLLRADGSGLVELVLGVDDVVVDHT